MPDPKQDPQQPIVLGPPNLTSPDPHAVNPSAPVFTSMRDGGIHTMGALRFNATKAVAERQEGRASPFLEQLLYDRRTGEFAWTRVPTYTEDLITPVLVALQPSAAVVGGPDIILEVWGDRFTAQSIITWNGLAVSTTFVTNRTLTTPLKPSQAVAGEYPVSVKTGTYVAAPIYFRYHPAPTPGQLPAPPATEEPAS